MDPTVSAYYDKRGFFKLSTNLMDKAHIFPALKDFDRAVQLDPQNAVALFHHAQCSGIVISPDAACSEFTKAKSMDPSLEIENFRRRYCDHKEN